MAEDKHSKNYDLRDHFQRRYSAMEEERVSFLAHWQDIADHTSPRSVRINNVVDNSKGVKYNQRIIDPTATLASRTLASGLMSGLTSPARPWFRIETTDLSAMEDGSIKNWLYDVETAMRDVFAKSNLYQILPSVYKSLGDFGTGCMSVLEDEESTIRCNFYIIGTYMVAVNQHNRCDSFYRRYPRTVRQVVKQFGLENVSPSTKQLFDSQQYETEIEICHVIEPNTDRDKFKFSNDNKPYRSAFFEWGSSYDLFLEKSGFDEFPVMCPRWDLWDDSCYGYSPGMDALGSNKALQLADKRETQAVDWYVRPHYLVDSTLRNKMGDMHPGGYTYIAGLASNAHAGARPLREVNPSIKEIDLKIQRYQQFIKRCYFEDMMSMLSQSDNPEMTAREIEERHSEKVLILGPVMERLNDELYDELIKRTFGIMDRAGMIPPMPEAMQGKQLKIEYTSILAQAQKLLGTANIEKVSQFVGSLAGMNPEALDKIDVDEAIDTYAEMHGINPNIIRTKDKVSQLREIRKQQQQAAQMAQMARPMKDAAQAGKALGETDGANVQDLVSTMTGQQAA